MNLRDFQFKNSQAIDILEEEFNRNRSSKITWDQMLKNGTIKESFHRCDAFMTN